MDWFCIVNGVQRGPLPVEELIALVRDGTLKPDDPVWTAAFGDQWRQARNVPEINPPVASASPAAGTPQATPVDAQPAFRTPLCGVTGQTPHFGVAVQQAWERMVSMLFAPCNPGRWLSLAFCAWVAMFSLLLDLPTPKTSMSRFQEAPSLESLRALYSQAYQTTLSQFHATGVPLPLLLACLTMLMILVGLLSAWLRARGTFMLLHRWHQPDATIAESWRVSQGLGRSLFLFRLGFGLVMALLLGLIGVGACFSVILPLGAGAGLSQPLMLWMVGWTVALLLLICTWIAGLLLLNHWVAPVMYWRRVGVMAAWGTVLNLCNERPGSVMIYLVLYPLLALAALLAVAVFALCTCCTACVALCIPYVNALLLLPLLIFFRGLGIAFLRQWRPDLAGR